MFDLNSLNARWVHLWVLLLASSPLLACEADTPPNVVCASAAPSEEITSFQVEIKTGDDGSDADIFFCITVKSDPERICNALDSADDDFSAGAIGTYEIQSTIAANDLQSFRVENRGGAPGLSFDGDDWKIAGLRVIGRTASGGTELVDATNLVTKLDAGEIYDPACAF